MKIFAILVFLTLTAPALAKQICQVHDGDTIKLCTGQSIRFHGIDAPERHQPMGYASRDYLMSFLEGKRVDLNCNSKSAGCERMDGRWRNIETKEEVQSNYGKR